jgi:hypothetical protein
MQVSKGDPNFGRVDDETRLVLQMTCKAKDKATALSRLRLKSAILGGRKDWEAIKKGLVDLILAVGRMRDKIYDLARTVTNEVVDSARQPPSVAMEDWLSKTRRWFLVVENLLEADVCSQEIVNRAESAAEGMSIVADYMDNAFFESDYFPRQHMVELAKGEFAHVMEAISLVISQVDLMMQHLRGAIDALECMMIKNRGHR